MGRKPKLKQNQENQNLSSNLSIQTEATNNIDVEKIEELKNGVIEEREKKERKPRGSAKQKIESEKKNAEFAETISGIGSLAMNMIVTRLPKAIPLTDAEKKQFDLAFDRLVMKYAPAVERFQEETAFLFATILIVVPRLGLLDKKPTKPKNPEPQPEPTKETGNIE